MEKGKKKRSREEEKLHGKKHGNGKKKIVKWKKKMEMGKEKTNKNG